MTAPTPERLREIIALAEKTTTPFRAELPAPPKNNHVTIDPITIKAMAEALLAAQTEIDRLNDIVNMCQQTACMVCNPKENFK